MRCSQVPNDDRDSNRFRSSQALAFSGWNGPIVAALAARELKPPLLKPVE